MKKTIASAEAREPERNAEESSAGMPSASKIKVSFRRRRRGYIFPAPSTKKPAPHDSKHFGLVPGFGTVWPLPIFFHFFEKLLKLSLFPDSGRKQPQFPLREHFPSQFEIVQEFPCFHFIPRYQAQFMDAAVGLD